MISSTSVGMAPGLSAFQVLDRMLTDFSAAEILEQWLGDFEHQRGHGTRLLPPESLRFRFEPSDGIPLLIGDYVTPVRGFVLHLFVAQIKVAGTLANAMLRAVMPKILIGDAENDLSPIAQGVADAGKDFAVQVGRFEKMHIQIEAGGDHVFHHFLGVGKGTSICRRCRGPRSLWSLRLTVWWFSDAPGRRGSESAARL